jgi:hypothetical protein
VLGLTDPDGIIKHHSDNEAPLFALSRHYLHTESLFLGSKALAIKETREYIHFRTLPFI